ncbi:hypothetical protein BC829DRAFT_418668 [Chytridium lagenaria]|nr:hypothetical protein BC829DRAFT_418668 [Chytridium lagenaria]
MDAILSTATPPGRSESSDSLFSIADGEHSIMESTFKVSFTHTNASNGPVFPSTPPRRTLSSSIPFSAFVRREDPSSHHHFEPAPLPLHDTHVAMTGANKNLTAMNASELMSSATSSLATPLQSEPPMKWGVENSAAYFNGNIVATPSVGGVDVEDYAFSPTSPCPPGVLSGGYLGSQMLTQGGPHIPARVAETILSGGTDWSDVHPLVATGSFAAGGGVTGDSAMLWSPLRAGEVAITVLGEKADFAEDRMDFGRTCMQVEISALLEDTALAFTSSNSLPVIRPSGASSVGVELIPPQTSSPWSEAMEVQNAIYTVPSSIQYQFVSPLEPRTGDFSLFQGSKRGGLVRGSIVSDPVAYSYQAHPSFQNLLFKRRRAASSPLAILITPSASRSTSKKLQNRYEPAPPNLFDLPAEVLTSIFLCLPNPTILCLVHRYFHNLFTRDAVAVARWLVEHNHTVPRLWNKPGNGAGGFKSPSSALGKASNDFNRRGTSGASGIGNGVMEDLRPILPSHPLLACLKHPTRHRVLRVVPEAARCLLWMAPKTSRYDLQRIHRRSMASDRALYAVANIVSERAFELFGGSVANTVSIVQAATRPVNEGPLGLPPALPLPMHGYQIAGPVPIMTNAEPDPMLIEGNHLPHIAPAAEWTPPLPNHSSTAPFGTSTVPSAVAAAGKAILLSTPTVDDRRALLDAAVGGDSATVGVLIDACALGLDARVVAEAFARAWDRSDTGRLCVPEGWLWPRCQASRWLVLERLAREDEEHANAVLANVAGGVGEGQGLVAAAAATTVINVNEEGEGIIATMAAAATAVVNAFSMGTTVTEGSEGVGIGIVATMSRILAEAVGEEHVAKERQRKLREEMVHQHSSGGGWGGHEGGCSWMSRRAFIDRALDAVVACGSGRAVTLVLAHGPQLHPRHITAALDRGSIHIFCLLISFGADPTWPEDAALSRYIRRPPTDLVAGVCWRHAFSLGTQLTQRRWESAMRLGPRSTSACLDAWSAYELIKASSFASTSTSTSAYSSMPPFDPRRHFGIGFKLGGPEVIRVLSDAVDASFECGDVLTAASFGDSRALQYCMEVGQALAEALREGDRDRAGDLLDAGALVLDDALCYSASIADSPPGDWDEWPTAARCYRRVLVQQRLRLPLPSRDALINLPAGVVTEALLCSLQATRPLCDPRSAVVYARYQRRRHPNAAGIRINLIPVLEGDRLLAVCDDPAYPGEAYCFIKGMLQFGLRDKNLLRDEDEFFLPDDEWDEVAAALMSP